MVRKISTYIFRFPAVRLERTCFCLWKSRCCQRLPTSPLKILSITHSKKHLSFNEQRQKTEFHASVATHTFPPWCSAAFALLLLNLGLLDCMHFVGLFLQDEDKRQLNRLNTVPPHPPTHVAVCPTHTAHTVLYLQQGLEERFLEIDFNSWNSRHFILNNLILNGAKMKVGWFTHPHTHTCLHGLE